MHPAVTSFQEWMAAEYRPDGSLDVVRVLTGADTGGADLSVRLQVDGKSYYEARVDLGARELQVGFSTEGRVVNEEIEQMVLDNGGDLNELLGDELCDLGEEPLPMDHFFQRPAFRYLARIPLTDPDLLGEPATRERVKTVIKACRALFQPVVDGG
jgi:hypothetical protein